MTKPTTPKYRGGRKPLPADVQKSRVLLYLDRAELRRLVNSPDLPTRSQEIVRRELERNEAKA